MGFLFSKRTPTVIQMEALECGAAALSMILGHFGRYVSLEQLRVECAVSRDGSKASNILKAARQYGLKAKGYQRELEDLAETPLPAIVFWEFNHFVVLDQVDKKKYRIKDPAIGLRTLTTEEFSRSFTGVVLEFELGPSFTPGGEKPSFVSTLFEPFHKQSSFLTFSISLAALIAASALIIPALIRAIVDDIVVKDLGDYFAPLFCVAAIVFLFRAALVHLQKKHISHFAHRYRQHVSKSTFWHILRLPIQFFSQRFVGDIANRIQSGNRIGVIATDLFSQALFVFITFALLCVVLARYSLTIAASCVGLFILNVLVFSFLVLAKRDRERRLRIERDRALSNLINGLSSIETLKASGRESEFFARFSGFWAKAHNVKNSVGLSESTLAIVPLFLALISSASVWVIGSFEYFSASMTIGMLVASRFLSEQLFQSAELVTQNQSQMDALVHESRRTKDVVNYKIAPQWEQQSLETARTFNQTFIGNISLSNLSFGYDRYGPSVIDDITVNIKAKSRVAFVGATGSGKSTIGKLIAGFYDPWKGEVLFDGLNRSQIPHETLTRYVAYVEQDIYLFSGTILENLSLFDASIAFEDVVRAAQDAMIHDDIIAVFGGYDSHVAEGGKNLSGGQIQRLEIARALARNPKVLILDEATSALDPPTEKKIDENLRRRGCTLIMVAHRLSTIRDSDEIIVLDNGRIAQRGVHDQLISEVGPYQNLIQKSG